jgi:hypothetical protein
MKTDGNVALESEKGEENMNQSKSAAARANASRLHARASTFRSRAHGDALSWHRLRSRVRMRASFKAWRGMSRGARRRCAPRRAIAPSWRFLRLNDAALP